MQSQNKLIEAIDLNMAYGNKKVFTDTSFCINKGDFVAITGPNGGGKSTMLKLILRLMQPVSGKITYYENNAETEHLKFGYLPQKSNIDSQFPLTVEEVIASGLFSCHKNWMGKYSQEVKDKIVEMLELLQIEDLRNQSIGTLSGGQLQRTLMGRALISSPEVIVMDEPLSYVDRRFIEQIYHIIEDLKQRATIIVVSHEMTEISVMANRHWIVDHSLHECSAHHHYLRTECD